MKKEHKKEAKAIMKTEKNEEELPVPLVTHVNKISPNVEVYINNQQVYNFQRNVCA